MNDAPASAMNTGTPASSTAMKMNAITSMIASSVRVNLVRDVVRPAPADARIVPDIDRLPDEHQEAAEADTPIDVAHRQVEDGHALDFHALDDCPGQVGKQSEKAELDDVDKGKKRGAQRAGLHHVGQQLDRDVGVAPRHHRAADEHDPHQAVACDLLGPGKAVVEDIAGEELQEDDEGERPEDRKRDPVLRVMLDDYLFVLRDDEVDVVVRRLLCAHDVPCPAAVLILRSRMKCGVSKDGQELLAMVRDASLARRSSP